MVIPILTPHPPGIRPALGEEQANPPLTVPGKKEIDGELDLLNARMEALQSALGAEQKRALLVVLQGRDACGKDATTRRVFRWVNPALCAVSNFKRPNELELRHDYLWRVHQACPPRGSIGVFNRSHYEDVLAVRVHGLVPEAIWRKRYDQINHFEAMLSDEGTAIVKFFLHISKEEQRTRLEERLADPAKNWKFQPDDLKERKRWEEYTEAYSDLLERTSTAPAPWFIVPADKSKARDFLVAQVVVQALERMDPQYPPANPEALAFRGKIE